MARRHGVHPQVLYAWRRLARQGELALQADDAPMFAAVLTAPEPTSTPGSGAPDVTIEFGDMRLRVGAEVSPERVAALVAALRAR